MAVPTTLAFVALGHGNVSGWCLPTAARVGQQCAPFHPIEVPAPAQQKTMPPSRLRCRGAIGLEPTETAREWVSNI